MLVAKLKISFSHSLWNIQKESLTTRDPSETTYLERYTPSTPESHWDEGKKEELLCSEETA